MSDQASEPTATLPGVRAQRPRPSPPAMPEPEPPPEPNQVLERAQGLSQAQLLLGRARAALRGDQHQDDPEPDESPAPTRPTRSSSSASSDPGDPKPKPKPEHIGFDEDELASIEGATAAGIVVISRIVNWLANKTVLRGQPRDLITTTKEARRIAKPLSRFVIKRFNLGDMTITERRNALRGLLAGGLYGARVAEGKPGGAAETEKGEELVDEALAG